MRVLLPALRDTLLLLACTLLMVLGAVRDLRRYSTHILSHHGRSLPVPESASDVFRAQPRRGTVTLMALETRRLYPQLTSCTLDSQEIERDYKRNRRLRLNGLFAEAFSPVQIVDNRSLRSRLPPRKARQLSEGAIRYAAGRKHWGIVFVASTEPGSETRCRILHHDRHFYVVPMSRLEKQSR